MDLAGSEKAVASLPMVFVASEFVVARTRWLCLFSTPTDFVFLCGTEEGLEKRAETRCPRYYFLASSLLFLGLLGALVSYRISGTGCSCLRHGLFLSRECLLQSRPSVLSSRSFLPSPFGMTPLVRVNHGIAIAGGMIVLLVLVCKWHADCAPCLIWVPPPPPPPLACHFVRCRSSKW